MHAPRHELLSQLGCGFGIQLRVIGWPLLACSRGLCLLIGLGVILIPCSQCFILSRASRYALLMSPSRQIWTVWCRRLHMKDTHAPVVLLAPFWVGGATLGILLLV